MMNDKDLKRNASGYVDEPCYRAVTAPPRPGEIWLHSKSGAQMLVLANVDGICPTLKLVDVNGEGSVSVTGKTVMYAKPYMIGYCFENLLTEFVKSVKGEEMMAIRKGMVKTMGLAEEAKQDNTVHAIPQDYINSLEEQVKTLTIERDKARTIAKEINFDLEAKTMADKMVSDSIAEMEQEIMKLRIYKDMYMDIIGKLVALRGGAVNE